MARSVKQKSMSVNVKDAAVFLSLGFVNICCFLSPEAMFCIYCSQWHKVQSRPRNYPVAKVERTKQANVQQWQFVIICYLQPPSSIREDKASVLRAETRSRLPVSLTPDEYRGNSFRIVHDIFLPHTLQLFIDSFS